MGTYYTVGEGRQAIVDECCRDRPDARCIASSRIGNELWIVWESTSDSSKRIELCLLTSQLFDGDRSPSWGYKPISEAAGPYYYKCPLRFLSLAEVQNEEWRTQVRHYHATKGR